MTFDAKTLSLGRQIAKVLDAEGVKPPLRFQAWNEIHALIAAAFADGEDTKR